MERVEMHPWKGCSRGELGSRMEKWPWGEAASEVLPPRWDLLLAHIRLCNPCCLVQGSPPFLNLVQGVSALFTSVLCSKV